ncbi:hypothetical protein [Robertmurraya massiliosenegalensis]|uniref:hypothetical protein n=1 Tax=Robertmurraya massiliosenegalensis TaxID=1287657 RepID=UPI0003170CFC|nr:hypothetical protein [Robertmurraya massiliosenegalensis]
MKKSKFIIYMGSGILFGLFILPTILPFNFADVFVLVFGEPNVVNRIIVSVISLVLIISLFRGLYKGFVQK